jgi:DNA-binding XRE family transcriptional regulator
MIDEATRVRTIHAFTGLNSTAFAAKLGVSPNTLTNWEKAKTVPGIRGCKALAKVMKKAKLVLLPSGMPVPKC